MPPEELLFIILKNIKTSLTSFIKTSPNNKKHRFLSKIDLICDSLKKFIQSSKLTTFPDQQLNLFCNADNLPLHFSQRWLMQTAPLNYEKMVAQIKLCKRGFKITCSSFSVLMMDLQSICHVTPGSSGISVNTEGGINSKPSL